MPARSLVSLALICTPIAALAETAPPTILGAWVTPLAEQSVPGASAYVRERLVFAETTNTISIEAFADPAGEVPLFTYASSGSYRLGGPSDNVPGAWILDAENDASTVTIFQNAPAIWQALNLGACPLQIGVAVDIADCVAGPPFNAAKCLELDLVAVEANTLRLGARDTDRCKVRPTSLGQAVYGDS